MSKKIAIISKDLKDYDSWLHDIWCPGVEYFCIVSLSDIFLKGRWFTEIQETASAKGNTKYKRLVEECKKRIRKSET